MLMENFADIRLTCSTWNIKGWGGFVPFVPLKTVLIVFFCPADFDREGFLIVEGDFDGFRPFWIGCLWYPDNFNFNGCSRKI